MNNKGQTTVLLAFLIVGLFIGLIIILVIGFFAQQLDQALDINVSLGQVNLAEENAKTLGKYNEMVSTSADWWGVSLIFGMILGMGLSSYFLRGSFPKWGLVLDIFIIIFAFIVSLYVSASYSTLLDTLAGAGITYLEDNVRTSSLFLVNLPVYVVIIGIIMMILFHSSIPKRSEERLQQGGFLQGVQ